MNRTVYLSLLPLAAAWCPHQAAAQPAYFAPTYRSALSVPVHPIPVGRAAGITPLTANTDTYGHGIIPPTVGQTEVDPTIVGAEGTDQPAGAVTTATNAFFQSLGQNGRSCVTCHQPPSGMSVSLTNINGRLAATKGTDPIFASVDGANCPSQVNGTTTFSVAHSLLLNRGLFRIFLPVPTQTIDNPPVPVEYTITVVSDPNGCNTNPLYSTSTNPVTGVVSQMVSVYRRPTISANLGFKTTTSATFGNGPKTDPTYGTKLPIDPLTGLVESGNLMSDGREPDLQSQAIDATLGHAQALTAPTTDQVNQMVQFESGFSAAAFGEKLSTGTITLSDDGASGGAIALATVAPAQPGGFDLYNALSTDTGTGLADLQRESIYRGQQLFNTHPFKMSNVAGFNPAARGSKSSTVTCSTCHSQRDGGSDNVPDSQKDLGIGGDQQSLGGPAPASDLPVFQVTCKPGFATFFLGSSVLTNDPGLALITGRCSDVGRFTTPQLRAAAAHPPFFTDGSAATMNAVVTFYNTRFKIGLSTAQQADLVAFLNAL